MRRVFTNAGYIIIILIFVVFNVILLQSLKETKNVQGKIKPKIVLISHVYSNPYWQYIRLGAEKAAEERNAVIEYQGPDSASVDESIKLINIAHAAKVSGIITYVQDEDKYNPIINKVVESGIPLVTVDSDAGNSKRLAYVGTDNVSAGKIGAEELIRQVGKEGKVAIIMGGKDVENQIERVNGFNEYLSKNSNLVVADIESSDSYLLEAELVAKKILIDNSNIKALFCTSALDAVGASKAINGLDLAGKVKVISFDDLPETLDGIQNGTITSTIAQKPYLMGYKAVNIIMDNIEGKETKGVFFTDVIVVSKSNLEMYKKEQGEYTNENQ